jgi:hypothetical protein
MATLKAGRSKKAVGKKRSPGNINYWLLSFHLKVVYLLYMA